MAVWTYVFLVPFGDIEPGVYDAEWKDIQPLVKSNPRACQQVSAAEGWRMLEAGGVTTRRGALPKAKDRMKCWRTSRH